MLFLKRSSDVFDAEREKIVGSRIEQGMAQEKAEGFDEDPDYYDGFFVPERARWAYLKDKLGDAKERYGSILDKALGARADHNDTLEHVLNHISFMQVLAISASFPMTPARISFDILPHEPHR